MSSQLNIINMLDLYLFRSRVRNLILVVSPLFIVGVALGQAKVGIEEPLLKGMPLPAEKRTVLQMSRAPEANIPPGEPTFGPEFSFTNSTILQGAETGGPEYFRTRSDAHKRMLNWVRFKCPDCTVSNFGHVQSKDGWWFNVTTDPGVIEVQMKPVTASQARALQDRIQGLIFDSAAHAGLFPHRYQGGGHIHIGAQEAFGNDHRLFRNFVVDFANHPELATGVFNHDPTNSPHLFSQNSLRRAAFRNIIQLFDEGGLSGRKQLSAAIQDLVYPRFDGFDGSKHTALNLSKVVKPYGKFGPQDTVEIRSFRPQESAEEWVRQVELLDARIHTLKGQGKNLAAVVPNQPGVNIDQKAAANFKRYVEESGLDWQRYKRYVPAKFQDSLPSAVSKGQIAEATVEVSPRTAAKAFSIKAKCFMSILQGAYR